jgi:hypothetical protein
MITKEEFLKYEEVRKSGITNMFDVYKVMELTNLKLNRILIIMNTYTELKVKYLKD